MAKCDIPHNTIAKCADIASSTENVRSTSHLVYTIGSVVIAHWHQ